MQGHEELFRILKTVYGLTTSELSPLLHADGNTLITDKEKILECWEEHFLIALNLPPVINEGAITCLPQVPINNSLYEIPTQSEVEKKSGDCPVAKLLTVTPSQQWYVQWVAHYTLGKAPKAVPFHVSIVHLYKRKLFGL